MDLHIGLLVVAAIIFVVAISYKPQIFLFLLEVLCAILNATSGSNRSKKSGSDFSSKGGESGGGGASSDF